MYSGVFWSRKAFCIITPVCRFEPYRHLFSPLCGHCPLFIFFLSNSPYLARLFQQYRPIKITDKHRNKLMRQSYSFIFKRLKTTLHAFLIHNTFISNTQLRFNLKKQQSQVSKGVKRKINILNERLAEERALLQQNPYLNEKQCFPLL